MNRSCLLSKMIGEKLMIWNINRYSNMYCLYLFTIEMKTIMNIHNIYEESISLGVGGVNDRSI